MRTFSKPLRRFALCCVLAFSIFLPCAQAKDKAKDKPVLTEQTVKLDPMEVKTNPFAAWGIWFRADLSVLNWVAGGPMKNAYVTGVIYKSPADLAGVRLGDRMSEINGYDLDEVGWREIIKIFEKSEKGDVSTFTLFDWAGMQTRCLELKLIANRKWLSDEKIFVHNCWGLIVFPLPEKDLDVVLFRELRLKETVKAKSLPGWIPGATVLKGKKRVPLDPEKLVPVRVRRRAAVIKWKSKKLTLIERENRVVEVIEGGEVPKKDDVVGRLMQEGSTLTLRADGTYELKDAPPKAEPAEALPVVTQNPPVASASGGPQPSACEVPVDGVASSGE